MTARELSILITHINIRIYPTHITAYHGLVISVIVDILQSPKQKLCVQMKPVRAWYVVILFMS